MILKRKMYNKLLKIKSRDKSSSFCRFGVVDSSIMPWYNISKQRKN